MEIIIGIIVAFFVLAIVLVSFSTIVDLIFGVLGWLLVGALIIGGLIVVGAGQPEGWITVVIGVILLGASSGG